MTGQEPRTDDPAASRDGRRAGGVVTLVLAAAGAVLASRLPLGTLTDPGPGLWPLAVALATALASLAVIVTDVPDDYEGLAGGGRRIAVAVAAVAVLVVLFTTAGFILSGLACFVFWLRFLGRESWRLTAIVSAGGVGVLYVLFALVLRVPLPPDLVAGLWEA
ncbi:tripartite tricarboxylate transporter TctB family protein [Nonomuraea rhizosphaerae]|uniref:tripartite tricarboxylate transporter TctB family protein n=1 Tax=Nonomuraea rhizosphaerae TaxID=2665663 RepID=UPI001C5CF905|nr:tripartite tricarboxylate transporter TctB family protein [Nonomuraea rhizosphaerae]